MTARRDTLVTAVAILVIAAALVPALLETIETGRVYLFSREFLEDLPARFTGRGRLRFILQPTIATILGVRGAGGRADLHRWAVCAFQGALEPRGELVPGEGGHDMKAWSRHPVVYEINTWVWLGELGRKHRRPVDLGTVPALEWDALASRGFDAVWFMGVWERSPAGIAISMRNPGLLEDFRRALPDFAPEDNQSHRNVLAWCWEKGGERALVVVNFREEASQARVHVPWDDLRGRSWRLHDALSGEDHDRSGDEMRDAGLYVDLRPWQCHLFQVGAP